MQNRRNGRRMNLPNSDTVLVRIEYTVPASEQDLAATAAVLAASEQGWVIAASEQSGIMPRLPVSSPGRVEVTVAADAWPRVAAAIVKARRLAGPGWRTTTNPDPAGDRHL